MKVLSVDIGVHNMAFYIEKFDEYKVHTFDSSGERYDANGEMSAEFASVVDQLHRNGVCLHIDRINLSDRKGVQFDINIFRTLSRYLESIKPLVDECDLVLIEKQMRFNRMATRLEQHCVSWMLFNYDLDKKVTTYSSSNKTKLLGAPRLVDVRGGKRIKMSNYRRKRWACDVARHILAQRGDEETAEFIFETNKSKADDLSDVICQLASYKVKLLCPAPKKKNKASPKTISESQKNKKK